jgi:hypothetical protein
MRHGVSLEAVLVEVTLVVVGEVDEIVEVLEAEVVLSDVLDESVLVEVLDSVVVSVEVVFRAQKPQVKSHRCAPGQEWQ